MRRPPSITIYRGSVILCQRIALAGALAALSVGVAACGGSGKSSSTSSSTNSAYNLTVNNSASGSYALKVMTVVAVLFVPLVIAYQGWSFHVFRARVKAPATPHDRPVAPTALDESAKPATAAPGG
jgi:cytochrome bd-type quinol oxidase subunit 2